MCKMSYGIILGLVSIILTSLSTVQTQNNGWDLKISRADERDGRFLNVPIYYGDWVPIETAKSTIQNVASMIQHASGHHHGGAGHHHHSDPAADRLDVIEPLTYVRPQKFRKKPRLPPLRYNNNNNNNRRDRKIFHDRDRDQHRRDLLQRRRRPESLRLSEVSLIYPISSVPFRLKLPNHPFRTSAPSLKR